MHYRYPLAAVLSKEYTWRFSNIEWDGFCFENDCVISNNSQKGKHHLILSTWHRYYKTYKIKDDIEYFTFFSIPAIDGVLSMIGFQMSEWWEITKDNVVGVINATNEAKESMLILLLDKKIETKSGINIDGYEFNCTTSIQSAYVKNITTRILTMALAKKMALEIIGSSSGAYVFSWIFNQEPDLLQFQQYVKKNYDTFGNLEKDICAMLMPENYKLCLLLMH